MKTMHRISVSMLLGFSVLLLSCQDQNAVDAGSASAPVSLSPRLLTAPTDTATFGRTVLVRARATAGAVMDSAWVPFDSGHYVFGSLPPNTAYTLSFQGFLADSATLLWTATHTGNTGTASTTVDLPVVIAATPLFSTAGGSFTTPQTITIAANGADSIEISRDGRNWTAYTPPLIDSTSGKLYARSFKGGLAVDTTTITLSIDLPAHDSTLKALSVSGQTLTPSFASGVLSYTTDSMVTSATSAVILDTANASGATVTCNSGSCGSVSLSGANTAVSVKVANGSSSLTYTVDILRKQTVGAVAHDTTLKNLSVSGQTLTPSFTPGVLSYTTDSMSSGATSAVILDTANASGATVTCNSGSCGSVSLAGASTVVSVNVVNGSSSLTYAVDILRKQAAATVAHDTTLKALSVVGQTLTPSFAPSGLSYTTDSMVTSATSAVILDTANVSGATVTCNGSACGSVSLSGANTAVSVKVVNGSSSLTYTVDILRKQTVAAVAHDTTLKSLSVSGQTLTPSFASGVLSYTTDSMVTSATSAVILDTANASGATVTCNAGSCSSVSLSGANTAVSVKVANGSSSLTYTVNILRKQTVAAVAHDTTLKSLSVSGRTLTPSFAPGVLSYTTDSMSSGATSAVILDTANASGATVTCNGSACGSVSLSGANTAVSVKVVNGSSSLTYTVDILRKQTVAAVAHDTTLTALYVNGYSTDHPAFAAGVLAYTTDSVPTGYASMNVIATPTASGATVTCNGGSCSSVTLTETSTPVSVVVTNGTSTLTYTLDILRKQTVAAVAHDTTLAALYVNGYSTDHPAFAPGVLAYTTDSVPTGYASMNVIATPTASGATVTCNGGNCSSVTLTGTSTPVSVVVTNGTSTLTYTLDILRQQTPAAVAHDTTISWIGASNMTPSAVAAGVLTYTFSSASGSGFNMTLTDPSATVTTDLAGATCTSTRCDIPTLTSNTTMHLTVHNGSSSLTYTFILDI